MYFIVEAMDYWFKIKLISTRCFVTAVMMLGVMFMFQQGNLGKIEDHINLVIG